MSGLSGTPFSQIDGGRDAFDHKHAEVSLAAALGQARLSATLDRLGEPGQARWDPIAGEVELRGRTFEAQQLGSFDGTSWLWSWANPHLAIPEAKTVLARGLRDRAAELGVPAFAVPMIDAADESLPYMLGAFAIAHGYGEAYYLANQSQVYMFVPGQLDRPSQSPIEQLRRAIDALDAAGVSYDLVRGLPLAAERLGVTVVRDDRDVIAKDGTSELRFPLARDGATLRTLALCFTSKKTSLADLQAHLRKARGVAELPLAQVDEATLEIAGPGYTVRIARTDRLREVMREATRTGDEQAKRYGAVVTVSTAVTPSYLGTLMGIGDIGGIGVAKAWAPTAMLTAGGGAAPTGPMVAFEAIQVCERLHALPGSLVYDTMLRSMYPRS